MDPVSIIAYGFWIACGVFIANRIASNLVMTSVNSIVKAYRHHFEEKNILIFGDPLAGKTCLMLLLTTGKPYQIDKKGQKLLPSRTTGISEVNAAIIAHPGRGNFNRLEKVLKDVGGDATYWHEWKKLIREVNPHGIIYMIDGKHNDEGLICSVDNIFTQILSQYPTDLRNLRALHIFVNYADVVGDSEIYHKVAKITTAFQKRFDSPNNRKLRSLRWKVAPTHLSPNASSWPESHNALNSFGHDLRAY